MRRAGVAQIIAMAVDLFSSDRRVGLWRQPATTACILFQRFFARQSFTSHNRWTVASACLFLGCKVEELHRKARDIIAAEWKINPRFDSSKPAPKDPDIEYIALREHLCDVERVVLYTLEFDVAVQHPFGLITGQVKRWRDAGLFGPRDEKSIEAQTLDRVAAEVALSCATSIIGLLFTAPEIAVASLFIGVQHVGRTMSLRIRDTHVESLIDRGVLRSICDMYVVEAVVDQSTDLHQRKQFDDTQVATVELQSSSHGLVQRGRFLHTFAAEVGADRRADPSGFSDVLDLARLDSVRETQVTAHSEASTSHSISAQAAFLKQLL